MKNPVLVIMDLDNTVYDWYSAFIPAFYAMTESAGQILGCEIEDLLTELKQVHISKNDVEHPFSLLETKIVRNFFDRYGQQEGIQRLDPAFYAFNKTRKINLRLFDGFIEIVRDLNRRNAKIVAFTESRYFGAIGRIERLGITDIFEKIYCREQNESSRPSTYLTKAQLHNIATVVTLPSNALKPNPEILLKIISEFNADISETIYIGDSLSKDIFMAKQVGCFAVWAKYGVHKNPETYAKLVRISHWTDDDIARERYISSISAGTAPDFICHESILELKNLFDKQI